MLGLSGTAVPFGNVWIDDILYLFSCSDTGKIQILSGKLHSPFEVIKPNSSNSPANRSRFSCCLYNTSQILLIGGDGVDLPFTDVWAFDLKTLTWRLIPTTGPPMKRRSGHRAVMSGTKAYLFGGTYGLHYCTDLAILTFDSELKSYSCKVVTQSLSPVARCGHTFTLNRGIIYLYGGISEEGILLGDFWQLEFLLFPEDPRWRGVDVKGSQVLPRMNHVSWFNSNGDFFIAGGSSAIVNSQPSTTKGDRLWNDVWCYSYNKRGEKDNKEGVWKLTSVYETPHALLGSSQLGLVAVSHREFEIVETREPFSALNWLFSGLRTRQREFGLLLADEALCLKKAKDERAALEQIDELFKQSSEKVSDEANAVYKKYLDERPLPRMESEIERLYDEVGNLTGELMKKLSGYMIDRDCFSRPVSDELAVQLALKLDESRKELDREKAERTSEGVLAREQLKFLTRGKVDIPKLDAGDYESFEIFAKGLAEKQRKFACSQFYYLQVREYQRLVDQIEVARARLERMKNSKERKGKVINRLTAEVRARRDKLSKLEQELEEQKKEANDIESAWKKHSDLVEMMKRFKSNAAGVKQEKTQVESEADQLLTKVNTESAVLGSRPVQEASERLSEKLVTLMGLIKVKTSDEANLWVELEFEEIEGLANIIAPQSDQ
jgi:hypothetical protein